MQSKHISYAEVVYVKAKTKKKKKKKNQPNIKNKIKNDLSQFCQVDELDAVEKLTTRWILNKLVKVGNT